MKRLLLLTISTSLCAMPSKRETQLLWGRMLYTAADPTINHSASASASAAATQTAEIQKRIRAYNSTAHRTQNAKPITVVNNTINGVDLRSIPAQYQAELIEFADRVNQLAYRGNGKELRELLDQQRSAIRTGSHSQQLVAAVKARMIVNIYNTDLIQEILIIANDTPDKAEQAYAGLHTAYKAKQIDDETWAEIETVYFARQEVKDRIVSNTDMTLSSAVHGSVAYKTAEQLRQWKLDPLTEESLRQLNESIPSKVADYIVKHIAATYLMVHEQGALTIDEFYQVNKDMIDTSFNLALVVLGASEEVIIGQVVPRVEALTAPVVVPITMTAKIIVATLNSMFGNHRDLDSMIRKVDRFQREAAVMFKDNPKEMGKYIGKAFFETVYAVYKSDNPHLQANIAASKKIIGVTNASKWFANCTII